MLFGRADCARDFPLRNFATRCKGGTKEAGLYVPPCCIASKPRPSEQPGPPYRQPGRSGATAPTSGTPEGVGRVGPTYLPARKPGTIAGMTRRTLSPLDRLLIDAQNALGTLAGRPLARRPNPAQATPEVELDGDERRHAAGLMRINH